MKSISHGAPHDAVSTASCHLIPLNQIFCSAPCSQRLSVYRSMLSFYQGPSFMHTYRKLTPWHQNRKVHHRIHKSPPPTPILSNWIHSTSTPANLPKIHSDSIFPFMLRSYEWSLSFGPSHQNPVHFPLLSHACYMSRPPHSPWFDLHNDILGWV
jgi:hypothetical protein